MATLKHVGRTIVLRPVPTVTVGDELPVDGTRLWNLSTDAILLGKGFASAYSEVAGSSDPVVNQSPAIGDQIQFIQHRDMTANSGSLQNREWERTGLITPRSSCGVAIKYQVASLGVTETHLLNAAALAPQELFHYTIKTRAKGDIVDLYNGTKSSASGKVVDYTSPDFTTLGITNVIAQRDMILSNLAQRMNRMNNPAGNFHVAVCIGTAVATGATLISTLAVGQRVIIGYQANGVADTLTVSQSMKDAFVAATANAAVTAANSAVALGAMYIIPYHLSGTNPAPAVPVSGLQGAAQRASRLMFVCLDATKPYYEERHDFKTGMELGLTEGWLDYLATQYKMTSAVNSIGDYNKVRLTYREQQYREYTEGAGRRFEAMHIEYPNELVKGGFYDQFLITWCNNPTGNTGLAGQHHKILNIFIPNYTLGNATNNVFYTGSANPALTYFDGILQTFNDINGLNNGNLV